MKKSFLLAFILLVNAICFGQKPKANTGSIKVPIQIRWGVGETSFYHVSKTKETIAEDEYSKIKVDYDVRLKVLEKTDTTYKIEWLYTTATAEVMEYQMRGEILRIGGQNEMQELIGNILKQSEECVKNTKIIYTTDQFGGFKDIVNREEIKAGYSKQFKTILGGVTDKMPQQQRDSMEVFINFLTEVMVSDPDFGLTFEDIQLVHEMHGFELEVGQKVKGEGRFESPFSDKSYPIDMEILLSDYSSASRTCKVQVDTHFGKETLAEYTSDMLRFFREYGMDVQESTFSLELTSKEEFKLELLNGWVTEAKLTKRQKVNHDITNSTLELKLRL